VRGAEEAVVATTAKAEIVLTPYGFYGRCTVGCPWVSKYTPSKYKARMDAVMHCQRPLKTDPLAALGFHAGVSIQLPPTMHDDDPDRAPLHTKTARR
jgi:hypothetical protein